MPRTFNGTRLGRGAEATNEAAKYEQFLPRFAHKTLPGAPSGSEVADTALTTSAAKSPPLRAGIIWYN